MSMISSFLRKVGLLAPKEVSEAQVQEAEAENALRDNTNALQALSANREALTKTNERLRQAVNRARDNNPFADLEDLIAMKRAATRTDRTRTRTRNREGASNGQHTHNGS